MTPSNTPPSRLSRLAFRPGGASLEQAMATVSTRLEPLQEGVRHELDMVIEQLHQDCGRLASEGASLAGAMYERSNLLIGLAGWFGSAPLVQAAYSLCALLDRHATPGLDVAAISLHVQALPVLRSLPNHEAAQAVVDGLKRVAARA